MAEEKTITVQLQDLTDKEREEYGITIDQLAELEKQFLIKDRLSEWYDNLLFDGYWALYRRLTVGKANMILMALNKDFKINYKKPYKQGYNPNKEENEI